MADAIGRNEAATLGVAVNTDASKDPADGVDRLLGCVRVDGRDPAVCRTAIVGLERFFSERLCRGDLRVSLDPRDAKGASRKERLGEQYKTFTRRLCAVLADEVVEDGDAGGAKDRRARTEDDGAAAAVPSVSPRTQVLALRAVMELARSEHPGKLNNELYERALRAAVTGTAFSPELLGALTGRYLPCHDVRHHTYAAVGRMADEFRKSSSASASKRKRDDDDAGALEREQDTARNLYDVLNGCPPDFTDYAGTGASPRPGVDDQKSQNKAKKNKRRRRRRRRGLRGHAGVDEKRGRGCRLGCRRTRCRRTGCRPVRRGGPARLVVQGRSRRRVRGGSRRRQ
jgi:U3 small nucleolar RNA-associated protein 19